MTYEYCIAVTFFSECSCMSTYQSALMMVMTALNSSLAQWVISNKNCTDGGLRRPTTAWLSC
jgi:hypothetical protein